MPEPHDATDPESDLIGELGLVVRLAAERHGLTLQQLVTCQAAALGELLASAGEPDVTRPLVAFASSARFAFDQERSRQAQRAAR
jgi:hypothetical protein